MQWHHQNYNGLFRQVVVSFFLQMKQIKKKWFNLLTSLVLSPILLYYKLIIMRCLCVFFVFV